ncbi:hypothetical protein H0I29_05425 [Polaribacter sp. R2A056_3_33]|uniref:hypothetical protein n=1 Tax=Polaribacter sp. R2A056_3_33 TaxID=2745563 RepID=UPI001C500701|nr:hypothetical protein [Polaribacter sp. R2A056_3_33]QXP71527.1 hypothetical protein H0I29_05425 [Polaribacter sp. R2A056_3_33]
MRKEFLKSINDKLIVNLTFRTVGGNIVTGKCIPYDLGPSRKYRDKSQRYHFLILNGPKGKHNISILPIQILKIELTNTHFNPSRYIKWKPNWHLKRNWGVYS